MAALDPSKMNPMEKLKYLGLVNKICQELDNHIGVSDKTLAEFIIASRPGTRSCRLRPSRRMVRNSPRRLRRSCLIWSRR